LRPIAFDARNSGGDFVAYRIRQDHSDDIAFVERDVTIHILFEVSCDILYHIFIEVMHLSGIVFHESIGVSAIVEIYSIFGHNLC
jgi:hypothetical protein